MNDESYIGGKRVSLVYLQLIEPSSVAKYVPPAGDYVFVSNAMERNPQIKSSPTSAPVAAAQPVISINYVNL